jgi:hypothetical protein
MITLANSLLGDGVDMPTSFQVRLLPVRFELD